MPDRYEYYLPVRLYSLTNERGHWGKHHRRAKMYRKAALMVAKHELPCIVTIVRVGPRRVDSHDNLTSCCKGLVDGIAARFGVDDSDPRIEWRYDQVRGDYGAIVRVEPRDA